MQFCCGAAAHFVSAHLVDDSVTSQEADKRPELGFPVQPGTGHLELPQVCRGIVMSMLVSELMAVNNFGVQVGYPHLLPSVQTLTHCRKCVSVQDQLFCGSSLHAWQVSSRSGFGPD